MFLNAKQRKAVGSLQQQGVTPCLSYTNCGLNFSPFTAATAPVFCLTADPVGSSGERIGVLAAGSIDMWPVIGTIIFEITGIIFALFVFIAFVGVKVSCAQCRMRFYHYYKYCPSCGWKLGDPPIEMPPTDEDQPE